MAMVEANIRPVFALVELAKYYEHRLKDYNRAAKAAQMALENVYKKNSLVGYTLKDEIVELKKRLERIKCKQKKYETRSLETIVFLDKKAYT